MPWLKKSDPDTNCEKEVVCGCENFTEGCRSRDKASQHCDWLTRVASNLTLCWFYSSCDRANSVWLSRHVPVPWMFHRDGESEHFGWIRNDLNHVVIGPKAVVNPYHDRAISHDHTKSTPFTRFSTVTVPNQLYYLRNLRLFYCTMGTDSNCFFPSLYQAWLTNDQPAFASPSYCAWPRNDVTSFMPCKERAGENCLD